jgi:hypothetical protein
MNEQDFGFKIRHALEDSAEQLPFRVTHRLAAAREAALARMPVVQAGRAALAGGPAVDFDMDEPSRLRRLLIAALPVLVVVAGLITISFWDDFEKDEELADVDAAMLTDDVPISAYTDRGFGVFLKNNRQ